VQGYINDITALNTAQLSELFTTLHLPNESRIIAQCNITVDTILTYTNANDFIDNSEVSPDQFFVLLHLYQLINAIRERKSVPEEAMVSKWTLETKNLPDLSEKLRLHHVTEQMFLEMDARMFAGILNISVAKLKSLQEEFRSFKGKRY
jgi:hypothetical protein